LGYQPLTEYRSGGRLVSVSVVICTYTDQRWSQLRAAVDSARAQTQIAHQIIVVVDHNDGLEARARAELSDVVVVANRGPRGLSGARNTGVDVSTGDVVAFIDDDAVADREWLARLTAPFASADVAGAGGLVVPDWSAGRPRWFPEEFDWVVGCSYRGMPTSSERVRNPIGCNMAFRRDVFAAIGGFRTDLGRIGRQPVGAEETELCIRLAEKMPAARVVHVPDAAVHHAIPASRATWRYFAERCYGEGISKATLGRIAGAGGKFSTEWRYVGRTLPWGVLRGIGGALVRRDLMGIARATAIGTGLTVTLAGFLVGSVRRPSGPVAI
jgi:glycosyltransferase involved in cell wall biosynthesis